jgi:hypothetical protein
MTRTHLAEAGDPLASAADGSAGDAAERLDSLSDQLDTLVGRDPDHGRLTRIEPGSTRFRLKPATPSPPPSRRHWTRFTPSVSPSRVFSNHLFLRRVRSRRERTAY